MQLLLAFALLGSVACQFFFPSFIGGDHIHDFSFQYHRGHDLLVIVNRHKCYLVEMTAEMEKAMAHHDDRIQMEDALYAQIQAGTGLTKVDPSTLAKEHHDIMTSVECRHHDSYTVDYKP